MSYLYDNPLEQQRLSDTLDRQPAIPQAPALFQNFWAATGSGLARGALKLGEAATYLSDPESLYAQSVINAARGDPTNVWEEDQKNRAAARDMMAKKALELTPNPLITGTGSKIAGGFAEVLPTAVIAGAVAGPVGAMAAVGSAQGVGDYQESIQQGIDPDTAAKKALLTGVTAGVGVALPMAKAGASLGANLGIGAGVNVVTGGIQRGGTAAILAAGGYHDQAAQYKVLDGEAIMIDTLLGAAFGGVGHVLGKPSGEQVDAALKLNERQHAEIEGQPGIHTTPASRDQGVRAFEETLHGLLNEDRAPDVTDRVAGMSVERNPEAAKTFVETKSVVDEAFPAPETAVVKTLPDATLGVTTERNANGEFYSVKTEGVGEARVSYSDRGVFTKTISESGKRTDLVLNKEGEFVEAGEINRIVGETDPARQAFIGTPSQRGAIVLAEAMSRDLSLPDAAAKRAHELVGEIARGETTPEVAHAELAEIQKEHPPAAKKLPPLKVEVRSTSEKIDMFAIEGGPTGERHAYTAHLPDGTEVGSVAFNIYSDGTAVPEHVEVPEAYRLRTIASQMYKQAEADGLKVVPSEKQSPAGKAFSEARLAKKEAAPPSAEPKPVEARPNDVEPIYVEQTRQILDQRPDLEIKTDDGSVIKFSDAIKQADDEITAAEQDAELFHVAAACALGGMA